MKILIVSDTHRHDENLMEVLEREKPLDMLIHLGDVEGSEEKIRKAAECECHIVAGNNDYFSYLEKEICLNIGDYSAMLTHGHNYYVSLGTETIEEEALAEGMDIVMFGHTHKPLIEVKDNITLINPGSLSYPRQEGREPTYIVMSMDDDGKIDYQLKYLVTVQP